MRVAKPIVNLHENRDAGVDSQYLAVSEKFSFFDLSMGADCIGVLPNLRFLPLFPPAILGIYRDAPGKRSPGISRRLSGGRRFFEDFYRVLLLFVVFFSLFVTFATCDSWYPPRCTG